jgi:peptide/nickel transport system permease protein
VSSEISGDVDSELDLGVGAENTATSALSRRAFIRPRGGQFVVWFSISVIAVATFLAIFGPMLAPHDPNQVALSYQYVGPTPGHPLGYDGTGRDLLSRLMAGARTSMIGPLAVVLMAMVVGVAVAVASAWKGGWFDTGVSTVLDVLFAFPGILLAILAAAVFGAGLVAASIALAIAYTPYIARVVRGASLRERNAAYITALEVQGASAWRACLRHLVPNVWPLIVAQGTILFGYAMVDLAAISFIGLGVQPPQPDWGVMVGEGQTGLVLGYPMESISAGLCIVLVVVAFNLLGERLAERAEERR